MAVRDLTACTVIKDRLWVRIYIFIYIYFLFLYFSIEFLRGSVGVVRIGGPWTGPWTVRWTGPRTGGQCFRVTLAYAVIVYLHSYLTIQCV